MVAPPRQLSGAAAVVLALGALDFGLEQSIILPAFARLAAHYDTSILGVTWLGAGFLLAAAIAVPLCGRLGDQVGKKRMILVSLGLFGVGSVVCAVATSIAIAVVGRAIQGLGAAVVPLALSLARDTVPREQLPRVVGIVAGAGSVGAALGFLLSGTLVDAFGPEGLFWFLAAAALVLTIAVAVIAPESPVRGRVVLDLPGTALLGIGLTAFLLALSVGPEAGWVSGPVFVLVLASVLALTLFVRTESRRADPLVDLTLVRTRPFAAADLCAFGYGFAFFIGAYVIPLVAAAPEKTGYGLGLSVTEIGVLLVPTSIAGLIGGWWGGRVFDRIGARAQVTLGALLAVAGYVSLASMHDTAFALGAGSALIGFGWGLVPTGLYPVVLRNAGVDKTGIAASVVLVARNIGVSVGITMAAAVVASTALVEGIRTEAAYTRALVFGAVAATAMALLATRLPGRR